MRWLRILLLSASVFALFACASDGDGGDGDGDQDGMSDVDAGNGNGGDVPFMGECNIADDQCVSGEICFEYGEGGMYCSHECTTDEQCPEPSRGCNNKGICKRP